MAFLLDPCLEYQGQRSERGYGVRQGAMRRLGTKYVHRQIMMMVGSDKYGTRFDPSSAQVVMHECDNPPCFRWAHLRVGVDNGENWDDMRDKGRGRAMPNLPLTHCRNGHEYVPGSFYLTKAGHRRCRECALRINRRSYRRRQK